MGVRRLIIGVAIAATFGLIGMQATRGQHQREGANLEDKYLKIFMKSDPRSPHALEDVHLRELGGQRFLVGTGADTGVGQEWHVGLTYWVEVTNISTIQVHHSLESLKKTYKP